MRVYTLEEIGNPRISLKEVNVNFQNSEITLDNFETTYIPDDKIIKKCSLCNKVKKISVIVGKTFNKPITEADVKESIEKSIFHKRFAILCEGCVVISKI